MRLNRVLLLAASLSVLIFAMVFTISCSGDDGKNGARGASCTAVPTATGYNVVCEDGTGGPLYNGTVDGLPAGTCLVKKVGTEWHAVCDGVDAGVIANGSTNPGVPSGGCAVSQPDKYNPFQLTMTCDAAVISLCGGGVIDPTTQVCTNGKTRVIDANKEIYNQTVSDPEFANSGATNLQDLGGVIIPLASFTCQTRATGDPVGYDPNKQFCKPLSPVDSLYDLCGAGDYLNTHFCLTTKGDYKNVVLKCGTGNAAQSFDSKKFCQVAYMPSITSTGTTIIPSAFPKYGKYDTFTVLTSAATGTDATTINAIPAGTVANLCGTEYEGKLEVNSDGEIITKTGGEWYTIRANTPNNSTFGLATGNKNAIGSFGGLSYYANGEQKCLNNTSVVTRCKNASGALEDVWYNANVDFCYEKTANNDTLLTLPLCLNASTGKPGSKPQYDNKNYFCNPQTGNQARMCGGGFYDDTKQFCWGGATTGDVGTICKGPVQKQISGSCPAGGFYQTSDFTYNGVTIGECVSDANNLYLRANYDPKTNNCGTIPDVKQGSASGNAYSSAIINSTTKDIATKEVAIPACGAYKINDGGWNWEFCVGTTVHYCGLNEVPNPDVLAQCKGCGTVAGEAPDGGTPGSNVIIANNGAGYCKCTSGYLLNSSYKCVPNSCTGATPNWNGVACIATCPTRSIFSGIGTAGSGTANTAAESTINNICVDVAEQACPANKDAVSGLDLNGNTVYTCCDTGKDWINDGTNVGCEQ